MNQDIWMNENRENPFRAYCDVQDYLNLREDLNFIAYGSYPFAALLIVLCLYRSKAIDLIVIICVCLMLLKSYAGMRYFYSPIFENLMFYGYIPFLLMIGVAILVMTRYMKWHWATSTLALGALLFAAVKFTVMWMENVGFNEFSTGSGSVVHLPHLIFFLVLIVILSFRSNSSGDERALSALKYLGLFWTFYAISTALNWSDIYLCSSIPTGTRFLGYAASATMLYFLLRGAIEIRILDRGYSQREISQEPNR